MGVAIRPGSAIVRRVLVLAAALLVSVVGVSAAQAAVDVVGTQDYSFASATHQPTAPTGEKPQSKLWFNDGYWWGSMWSTAKSSYDIQRFDPAINGWVDTGVVIDPRDKSQADMLWDGTHLYALSNVHQSAPSGDFSVRLYRFSYNATTRIYSPDAGFPVNVFTPATSDDLETTAIDKDSTGKLWATFTYANVPGSCATPSTCPAGRSVYFAHSTTSDAAWTTPAVLPFVRATDVSGNDVSSIVHFGNKIGVLYSDQIPDSFNKTGDYFAWHADGAPDTAWTAETALYGKRASDDHINLKAAPDGRLYAAVKTSLNDASATPIQSDPLIYLLARSTTGTWTKTAFDTVASQDTRSQILIDPAQNAIYQFATYPPDGVYESGGWIYCKVTSMDSPSFTAGRGTPFMQLAVGDHLNNFSSTKQTVGPDTGLLGVSADDQNFHYAHNSLALTGATPSCSGAAIAPPSNPIIPPPPAPPVTPPVTKPPVVTVPVVTPATPPVTTAVVPVTPVVATSSGVCRVVSSTIKVRSLSSRFSELKRNAGIRLRVKATCSVKLKIAAALGTAKGAIVARANVTLKRGTTRTVVVHLTSVGRKLLLNRAQARLVVTTRTPAVKGLSPARLWSTAIAFR
jgi:hypothetical protein